MSLIAGLNPWVTMWSQPRSTIRAIAHSKPAYGVYWLAAVYALQSFFFYANWWSVGLNAHFALLLALGIVLSPFMGLVWLYFMGGVYYLTGRLLKGEAPASHLRAAIAWSAIPYSIALLTWLVLIFLGTEHAFIHDSEGTSSIFVNLIMIIVGIWSVVLLIQSIREIQQFSIGRSILNVILSGILASIIYFLLFFFLRYIYLYN